uniref:RING-type domain-containing protein n=1 Tax=Leersia perrieri TaxID=77586 RepID=A0A0D9X1J2_9ORYZ
MAVTATTVAAATTMMAAVAAVFLAFVLCFYIFICAKRYRGGGATPANDGVAARLWFLLGGGGGGGGRSDGDGAAWCYDGGLDEASMAKLPCKVIGKEGDWEVLDCAVCITELAAGETARVLPRCGHGFHVACVDMWLKSHSTCPLCRCPAVDDPPPPPPPPAVQPPEVDPESPNFPTNVLFFGSQDDVSTAAGEEAARVARGGGLRRLLGCGGASPPPPPAAAEGRDIEMGLAGGGESSSPAKSPRHPSS